MTRIFDIFRRPVYPGEGAELRASSSAMGLQIPAEPVLVPAECRIVAHTDPTSPAADQFRLIRLRLNQLWNADKLKKLLITSPLPHDGKSTVALNLAVSLAEEGKRPVLLIDGDLHRATISKGFGLGDRPGVAECIEAGSDPCIGVRRLEPVGCCFLPAGNTRNNPSELLQSDALQRMMEKLSPHFDWILIDSPPVAPLTDALSWKARTDATLLLARAGRTPVQAVDEALNLVGRKHVLAIILNGVEGLDHLYSKYYKAYGPHAAVK